MSLGLYCFSRIYIMQIYRSEEWEQQHCSLEAQLQHAFFWSGAFRALAKDCCKRSWVASQSESSASTVGGEGEESGRGLWKILLKVSTLMRE